MRIVEAVAIAITLTCTSSNYTTLLKGFKIVEKDSKAFGCNRTGVMKAFIYDGRYMSLSVVQRVMHQETLEEYGSPHWTYDALPAIAKSWLPEESSAKKRPLLSFGNVTSRLRMQFEMSRLGSKSCDSLKRKITVQKVGGLFLVRRSCKSKKT